MKIFEFDFYNAYESEHLYSNILANSVDEAEMLLRQKNHFYDEFGWELKGCSRITELDKPKILQLQ